MIAGSIVTVRLTNQRKLGGVERPDRNCLAELMTGFVCLDLFERATVLAAISNMDAG